MTTESQKDFLSRIKKALEARHEKRVTWDELAEMAGIEPRTLKTYRMPEGSADYRQMPTLARQALEHLMAQPRASVVNTSTLVSALSSLVISQARLTLIDRSMVSGMDAVHGRRGGLTREDRRIMAMVSRFCLQAGLPDHGGEIHNLLALCKQPLEAWLNLPEIVNQGLGAIVLIEPEYGTPTPEAQDLALNFSTIAAHLEERLFENLKESLKRYPEQSAASYYTAIREFVVRNPVATEDTLAYSKPTVPGGLWMMIQKEYYEPIPSGLVRNGKIVQCAHCNSLMQKHALSGQLSCQSRACHQSRPTLAGETLDATNARRAHKSIHQYWVEPGIDEIFLYDALIKAGLSAELYPHQDRVDIAIGGIGMDLKTYASPEILGAKFKTGIGGLSHYGEKWVVIPDWLIRLTPNYLDRLRSAMGEASAQRLRCLSSSQALHEAVNQGGVPCAN